MAWRAGKSNDASNVKPFRRNRDRRIIAGVDLGASKAACFIAELPSGDDEFGAEIIGVGCHGASLRASGRISAAETEINLRRAVEAAERMAGVRVEKARIAAPGRFIRARRIGVDLEIADGVVTQEDVEESLAEGARLAAAPECLALQASPIAYRVDSEIAYDDPVGHAGGVLSSELLGLSVRESALDSLSSLVERCGLFADAFVPGPVAAATSCLLEDEMELGVALIDIGASSTGYAVYDDGVLIDCGGVSLGGGNITKDIAQIFGAPIADAERIKILHGAGFIGAGDEHRFIDFPQLGDGAETSRASRADLSEVIIPRMEEIFELVAARLPDDGRGRMSLRRAVITGGGSLLLGAREIAEKTLSMKTRIGRPLSLGGAPEASSAPGFSVCAGLIQNPSKISLGAQSQSLHSLTTPAFLGGARAWLRAKF